MTKMTWVRFFPSDWLGGTRSMTAAETGIYITLIASMYERGEPIVEDHGRLARLCGASNSVFKTALSSLIDDGKIIRTERGLWSNRVEKERVYISEKSEVGFHAARARWDKKSNENNPGLDANAMPTQCDGNAIQKPDTRYQNTSSLRSDVPREKLSDQAFETFWEKYPNKVGKPKAKASFSKAIRRADLQAIMAGLDAYVSKTDDRQWCNPTTWLNQDRWNDKPANVPRHRQRTIVDVIDELQEKANGHHQDNFFSGPTIDVFPSNGRGVATTVRSPSPTKWSEC